MKIYNLTGKEAKSFVLHGALKGEKQYCEIMFEMLAPIWKRAIKGFPVAKLGFDSCQNLAWIVLKDVLKQFPHRAGGNPVYADFAGYFAMAYRNALIDEQKSQYQSEQMLSLDDPALQIGEAAQEFDFPLIYGDIRRTLTPRQWEIFKAVYIDGCTRERVAGTMKISERRIREILAECKTKIRPLFSEN